MARFCPECGSDMKYDSPSKNFICKGCGLFVSSEKLDELRDKAAEKYYETGDGRKRVHNDYLDWWQSSKKDKQK